MALTIGVDVGGTKVAAGVVDDAGHVVERVRRATPSSQYPAMLGAIADAVGELAGRHPVTGVGLAIAGNVDRAGSSVLFSPHLPLAGEPLREDLQRVTGLPVVLDNDANAAAWAEYRFGAHGHDDLLMVTLGTGLGAGLVLGGQLYRGAFGYAGEAGHVLVEVDGRPCPCGATGCLERYASGTALLTAYVEAGGEASVAGPAITEAARSGSSPALAAYRSVGWWLGYGLASLVAVLDPGVIVVGGGLVAAGELLLGPAREALAGSVTGGGRRPLPALHPARMGNDAGMEGAADLARGR